MKAENFGEQWLLVELPFACEIHYRVPRTDLSGDRFKVLSLFSEPQSSCISHRDLLPIANKFDLILTHNVEDAGLPNAVHMLFGGAMVTEAPQEKSFSVSFLLSYGSLAVGRSDLVGYKKRFELFVRKREIKIPMNFFVSARNPSHALSGLPVLVDDKKDCMFSSMYHIAIENSQEADYFTEKIVDCFQTNTIPIYWGCPNVRDYFNSNGILVANTVGEMISQINQLTPEHYWSRVADIAENRERSNQYARMLDRMQSEILKAFSRRSGMTWAN